MTNFENSLRSAVKERADAEQKVATAKEELQKYGEQYKLRGLEGRIQRGLDPAGMLAVTETREKLKKVADVLGASIEDVVSLTNELHTGAIWKNADILAEGVDPKVQVWLIAGEATNAEKAQEGELTPEGFVKDLERVNRLLDEALKNPQGFVQRARNSIQEQARTKITVEDGIPISDADIFLEMAASGYRAGISRDAEGLLFVGADELDYKVLEELGLHVEEKEDRGRKAIFYVDDKGNNVVKRLYPGFAIVFDGKMDVAKRLAKSGMERAR